MNSRTLRLCVIAWAFVCASVFGELSELDGILTRAGSIDAFLADRTLVGEYYTALAKFYGGEDKLTRDAYDNILSQLRSVGPKVPGLKERLWETTNLGEPYSISVKMGRDSYHRTIDLARWNAYHARLTTRLATDAKPLLDLPEGEQEKRLTAILERVKIAREALESDVAGLPKGRAIVLRRERMTALNADPELRAAEAYLVHRFVTSEAAIDHNHGGNPDLILYFYRDARNNPAHLYRMLPEALKPLAEATLSRARGLLPSVDDLLSPREAIFKPQHSDLKPNMSIRYDFAPIPRRFHGIFWGARMGACVGGRNANDLTPEFWGAIALGQSQLHVVTRNGEFHGVVGMNPGKLGDHTYASVALAAPDLAKQMVRVDSATGEETPATLLSVWLDEAVKHKPKEWKGFLVAEGSAFSNWGTHAAARRLAQYVLGDPVGDAKNFTLEDPLARAIVQSHKPTGLATSYSGNMVLDSTVPSAHRLVMLRQDIDEGLLGDSNHVRQILTDSAHPLRLRLMDHIVGNTGTSERFTAVVARLVDDADPAMRRRALVANAVTHPDRVAVTEALAAYLREPALSDDVQRVVNFRLRELGEKGRLDGPTLEHYLTDSSYAVRLAFAKVLAAAPRPDGTKLTAALIPVIRGEDSRQSDDALRLLQGAAKKGHGDAELLATAMREPGPVGVRVELARLSAGLGAYGKPYTETMLELLPSQPSIIHEVAEKAARGFLDRPTIEKSLDDATSATVGDLMRIYLRTGAPDAKYAAQGLDFMLRHHPETEIFEAAAALAKMPPTEAMREKVIAWASDLKRTQAHHFGPRRAFRVLAAFPPDARAEEAAETLFLGNGVRPGFVFIDDLAFAIRCGMSERLLYPALRELAGWHLATAKEELKRLSAGDRAALVGVYAKALESDDPTLREVARRGLWHLHCNFRDEMHELREPYLAKVFTRVARTGHGDTAAWAATMVPHYENRDTATATLLEIARGNGPAHDGAMAGLRGQAVTPPEFRRLVEADTESADPARRRMAFSTMADGPPTLEALRRFEKEALQGDPASLVALGAGVQRLMSKLGADGNHATEWEIAARVYKKMVDAENWEAKLHGDRYLAAAKAKQPRAVARAVAKKSWWCFWRKV